MSIEIPLCPICRQPITSFPEQPKGYFRSNLVWNEAWFHIQPCCASCGYEFKARLTVHSGHTSPIESIPSQIDIKAGISHAWTFLDHLDYQPFIEIQISRAISGEVDGLATSERIRLTPEEWQTIATKLQSTLQPLLQQQAWWIDTT